MMLELHNVTIEPLIHSLSLTVGDGQLVCLSGSEGKGKTTLLRAILGFIPINSGHISIDGELLTPLSAPYFRRQIAYVPQHMSAIEDYDSIIDLSEMLFGLRVNKSGTSYKVPADGRRWTELSADERYLLLLQFDDHRRARHAYQCGGDGDCRQPVARGGKQGDYRPCR